MTFVYRQAPVIWLAVSMIGGCAIHAQAAGGGTGGVVLFSEIGAEHRPGWHGLGKLQQALAEKRMLAPHGTVEEADFTIIAGLSSEDGLAVRLLKQMKQPPPQGKEALLIRRTTYRGKPTVLLCGADDVGLMYAALDVAKRMSWSENPDDPFEFIADITEAPDVMERCVSMGTFHRGYFEQKLHDRQYWEAYFDMMAENRLNQFLLIFGYKNNQYKEPNFTAPVYPFFFDLDEYPYVKLSGITPEQQAKNVAALKEIINLAHKRGIEFGVGLWDQIERDKRFSKMVRDDVEAPDDLRDDIIWGLSKKNLIPYTKLAIRKFLRTFPEIDLVQFRMHWESGITGEVALRFWKEMFGILKEERPGIKVEARAKDVPDETLYDGADTGLDFRVATKHWMEQMGMPFHPTHIDKPNQHDRRHGYADLLRYPRRYGFKWRVWNGGTTRAFQWGDPDWVRLFAEGSHLYDGVGFEFNEPLYFKMNGSPHDAEVSELLNPDYRYYTYEFERYWHFYQLMGRLAYNPQTPADTWEQEFAARFGANAGPHLMRGLHQASKVLPRIVSASYLYSRFPSPQGWPELQRMEDLPHFALKSRPSDTQQFASPLEEAELILKGGVSPKRLPSQTSEWFLKTSDAILTHVERAEQSIGDQRSNEYVSTTTDLKMLAYLARYHSHRLPAAVHYALYDRTGDLASFDRSIEREAKAVAAYGRMVGAAGDVYALRLDFGSNVGLFPGHWKDEHKRLERELEELRLARREAKAPTKSVNLTTTISNDREPPTVDLDRVKTADLNRALKVKARATDASGVESVVLRYRRVSQFEDYQSAPMVRDADTGAYEATIPAEFFDGKYDVMYFVEVMGNEGNGRMIPDLEVETPYVIVHLDRSSDPVSILCPSDVPAIQFAARDLQQALDQQGSRAEIASISETAKKQDRTQIVLGLVDDAFLLERLQASRVSAPQSLAPEGYAIRLSRHGDHVTVWAVGADANGAMYAGLALAETIAHGGIDGIEEDDCQPYIKKRGLKVNVPFDARTPAYADCGDAAQRNIAVMWDIDFWKQHLDAMARHRYNTVTVWNQHPFPSIVKVPDYPDVALDDVMIADIDWREWFPKNAGRGGSRGVTQDILDNLRVVRKMTIDEKIEFWREVMSHAHDRGIEFHIITWNIFVWAADGKYGITNDVKNEVTINYLRKSVASLFETYPLLAGIGVTAGEHMRGLSADEKEQWLWATYGRGVMDARKADPDRPIRFIHRHWMSKIPDITKHFDGFDDGVQFDFSFKYVKARLYSHTDPTFADDVLAEAPAGTKWWWNLRNDDIFYFRWGDPDYVRDFIGALPPAERTEGFHMGSDGYVWGREFVSTEPESPRRLEIDKHWYNFMLWGRLGYDPSLSNKVLEKAMQQRFPGMPTSDLQEVWAQASRIIPAVNRFHWHDWDFQWAVELCNSRNGYHAITESCWKPGGGSVADDIQDHADYVLEQLEALREAGNGKEWRQTLGDLEAMSHLGLYYAEKIRAADDRKRGPQVKRRSIILRQPPGIGATTRRWRAGSMRRNC